MYSRILSLFAKARDGRQPDTTFGEPARPIKQFDPPFTVCSTHCIKDTIVLPLLLKDNTLTRPDNVSVFTDRTQTETKWARKLGGVRP